MNQRESSGLPLRAMVMVLLFLGVVFLLVGFQAMGSGDDSDSSSSTAVSTVTATPTTSASPTADAAPAKADVRVYNISEVAGAAESTANRLRDAQWNVTETGNLTLRRRDRDHGVLRRGPRRAAKPPTRWASSSRRRSNRGHPTSPINRRA